MCTKGTPPVLHYKTKRIQELKALINISFKYQSLFYPCYTWNEVPKFNEAIFFSEKNDQKLPNKTPHTT